MEWSLKLALLAWMVGWYKRQMLQVRGRRQFRWGTELCTKLCLSPPRPDPPVPPSPCPQLSQVIFFTHMAQRRAVSTGELSEVAQKPLKCQQSEPVPIGFSQRRQHCKRLCKCPPVCQPCLCQGWFLQASPRVCPMMPPWQQHMPLEMRRIS